VQPESCRKCSKIASGANKSNCDAIQGLRSVKMESRKLAMERSQELGTMTLHRKLNKFNEM